jgi:hypothetical protein
MDRKNINQDTCIDLQPHVEEDPWQMCIRRHTVELTGSSKAVWRWFSRLLQFVQNSVTCRAVCMTKWRILVRMFGFTGTSVTHSLLITIKDRKYRAIANLHTLQFTFAHALEFSVSTSRLLVTDLNTETVTSSHYEVFLFSVTLYSSVLICTQSW